jgi:hypothetical protein
MCFVPCCFHFSTASCCVKELKEFMSGFVTVRKLSFKACANQERAKFLLFLVQYFFLKGINSRLFGLTARYKTSRETFTQGIVNLLNSVSTVNIYNVHIIFRKELCRFTVC